MRYRLRYRIRDWLFRRLFPTIAMHEAHLISDLIHMAERIKELESKKAIKPDTAILTGTNDKTVWFASPN